VNWPSSSQRCCVASVSLLWSVLMRVLDSLKALRGEVESLRAETRPLLRELSSSTADARAAMVEAREDLDRFDRVLGSAEAISGAVSGGSRIARAALSAPVIKTVAIGTGTKRAFSRLGRKEKRSA
jgi:ABC-type transporter Mla subunit MlaD